MAATTYLVLLMALLISTFSLPTDMKNRTITTVVTKPVHTSEIVLGRIVGFTIIGTVCSPSWVLQLCIRRPGAEPHARDYY